MIDTACILAGGLGTRLRTLYHDRPKALVPVRGRPFMEHMLGGLAAQGVTRVHIAAGYRAAQIKEWADALAIPGLTIAVTVEPSPLGTAGGLKYALPFLAGVAPLLVLNGDSLLPNARLADLDAAWNQPPGLRALIAAVEMTERGQYGTLEIDGQRHITAFREKASNDRGWVNGGIYLLDPRVLDSIPENTPASLEKDVFPILARAGHLGAVHVPGPLLDMGTPKGLARMETMLPGSG